MDKSPDAFRTISEVAEHLDTPAHVLRFWESRFPQIKPVKRAGGRRYYRPSDVALLTGIKRLLHDEGLTIRGVQKILRDHGVRQVAGLTDDSVTLDELTVAEAGAAPAMDDREPAASVEAASIPDTRSAPLVTAPAPVAPAQPGLPLFDAPPALATEAAPRKPTLRDDATFASLIRGLPRGSLQAHRPELAGIAARLRSHRARLAARAEGIGD
ncbi:MAG: MerR family transcriptional regulator [Tabrizicola sp.]